MKLHLILRGGSLLGCELTEWNFLSAETGVRDCIGPRRIYIYTYIHTYIHTYILWRVFSVKIRTLIHNFDEVGQKLYEVGQLLDEVVPLLYEVGQLLDEVSPLTYELGYGRLAHIYEKKLGKSLGTKL